MSFFCNGNSETAPGRIGGNPVHNLCEKACIEVKKVFDACLMQTTNENVAITLSNHVPCNPTYPLTFISAKNACSKATISDLDVTPLDDRPHFARVQAEVQIPLIVVYVDANGVQGKADAIVTVEEDVVLYIPDPSIIPYEIEAVGGLVCPNGATLANNQFTVTACITLILKVVMDVDLLVPTYGYCPIPPCQAYNEEVCSGFFELPLFPSCGR